MTTAAGATETMVAADLFIYVGAPLLVALILGVFTWSIHLARRVAHTETAVALLTAEITPEFAPSLRTMVTEIQVNMATIAERVR